MNNPPASPKTDIIDQHNVDAIREAEQTILGNEEATADDGPPDIQDDLEDAPSDLDVGVEPDAARGAADHQLVAGGQGEIQPQRGATGDDGGRWQDGRARPCQRRFPRKSGRSDLPFRAER